MDGRETGLEWLVHAEPNTESKHDTSMSDVTEHNTEQEWKERDSEQTWVDLAVSRNTIRIDDLLEWGCEVIQLEV